MRQPRQLIAFVVATGLLFLLLLPGLVFGRASMSAAGGGTTSPVIEVWASLGLLFIVSLGWFLSRSRPALMLSEAEAAFLFAAPLTRRQIVTYSLLRVQFGILLSCLFFVLVFARNGSPLWTFLSIMMFLDLTYLHGIARSAWKSRVAGMEMLPRALTRGVSAGVFVAYVLALIITIAPHVAKARQDLAKPDHTAAFITGASKIFKEIGVDKSLGTLLWPPRLPLQMFFAHTGAERAIGFLILVGLILLHFEWIVRSDARYEEATLVQARRLSRMADPSIRFERLSLGKRQRAPFPLAINAGAFLTLVWKSVTRAGRVPFSKVAGISLSCLLVAVGVIAAMGAPPVLIGLMYIVGIAISGTFAFLAGSLWSNDFRGELANYEIVRAWPIKPMAYARAMVLAPALLGAAHAALGICTLLAAEWCTLLSNALGLATESQRIGLRIAAGLGLSPWFAAPLCALAMAIVTIAISVLSSALQNLAVLRLPGWFPGEAPNQQSMTGTGQRMLTSALISMALLTATIPGGLAAALVFMAAKALALSMSIALIPATLAFALPFFILAHGLTMMVADAWARFDPSRDFLPTST